MLPYFSSYILLLPLKQFGINPLHQTTAMSFSNLNRKRYSIFTVQTGVGASNIFPLDGSLTVRMYRFLFKLKKLNVWHSIVPNIQLIKLCHSSGGGNSGVTSDVTESICFMVYFALPSGSYSSKPTPTIQSNTIWLFS